MPRFKATANFRYCTAGEVYELEAGEWAEQIAAGWLVPYPDEDADDDWLSQLERGSDVPAGIDVRPPDA